MFNISEHLTDDKKRIEGVWVDLGGTKIKVASNDNPEFQKRMKKLLKQYEFSLNHGSSIDEHEDLNLITEVYADTVLMDWENVAIDDKEGNTAKLPFNRKNALMALRKSKVFRDIVMQKSAEVSLFNQERKQAILGNLKSSSSGN